MNDVSGHDPDRGSEYLDSRAPFRVAHGEPVSGSGVGGQTTLKSQSNRNPDLRSNGGVGASAGSKSQAFACILVDLC